MFSIGKIEKIYIFHFFKAVQEERHRQVPTGLNLMPKLESSKRSCNRRKSNSKIDPNYVCSSANSIDESQLPSITITSVKSLNFAVHGASSGLGLAGGSTITSISNSGLGHNTTVCHDLLTNPINSISDLSQTNLNLPILNLGTLLAAELSTDRRLSMSDQGESIYEDIPDSSEDGVNMHPLIIICRSVEQQLARLVYWARQLPVFSNVYLSLDDQYCLIKAGMYK